MISTQLADDRIIIPASSCKMKELGHFFCMSMFALLATCTWQAKRRPWQQCPRWASACASGQTKGGRRQAMVRMRRAVAHASQQDRQRVRLHSVAAFNVPPTCLLRPERVACVNPITVQPFAGEWDFSLCTGEGSREILARVLTSPGGQRSNPLTNN